MIKPGPDDTDQLTTSVDCPQVWPLIVTPVPLLRASLHLSRVVGSQGQTLKTMTCGHRPRGNEVVEGETVKGTECAPRTLHCLINCLSQRICPVGIVTGGLGVLNVVPHLEMLKALRLGIVDILGIGDKLRRRRSVGSRHFDVEDGLMV